MNYPIVMGKELTRFEIIEALWEGYSSMLQLSQQEDSTIVDFPDMKALIEWIDKNGLPPKEL